MWGVKLNIMFQGCRFFENKFKYRIGITQFTHLRKFYIIQSRFTNVGAFLLHNCEILKSYLSGELGINMCGVKLNIMFWGCRFFENMFKYRIGITQFTHVIKFSIIQCPFTKLGAFYLTIDKILKSYLSRESGIKMWRVKMNNMFWGCIWFLKIILGSHISPT